MRMPERPHKTAQPSGLRSPRSADLLPKEQSVLKADCLAPEPHHQETGSQSYTLAWLLQITDTKVRPPFLSHDFTPPPLLLHQVLHCSCIRRTHIGIHIRTGQRQHQHQHRPTSPVLHLWLLPPRCGLVGRVPCTAATAAPPRSATAGACAHAPRWGLGTWGACHCRAALRVHASQGHI